MFSSTSSVVTLSGSSATSFIASSTSSTVNSSSFITKSVFINILLSNKALSNAKISVNFNFSSWFSFALVYEIMGRDISKHFTKEDLLIFSVPSSIFLSISSFWFENFMVFITSLLKYFIDCY